MVLSIPLFALAARAGLVLALTRLRGQPPRRSVALIHGGLAAAGLAVLTLSVDLSGPASASTYALALFFVAALGGFYLFARDLRGRTVPIKPMVLHAALAVVAFVVLLAGAFLS